MENASKALLIAGAILIAILLIGIAMMIFGNIGGITGIAEKQVDQIEVQGFNRPFTQYEGTKVSGSNVKTLITNINTSNATYSDDKSRQITITKPDTIGANASYSVTFGYDVSGFINSVTITQNTK